MRNSGDQDVLMEFAPDVARWLGIDPTPICVSPPFVFRHDLRQVKLDADGGSAHAIQFGEILNIDVTLVELVSK